tara:strand:- start:381 stop:1757 length:1377 start_codon:yes stop_codon:yes gene_type:complete
LIYLYKKNKRVFKKIIYKTFFLNNKSFKNITKFKTAKKSLISLSEVNKLITDKVDSEIISFEKQELERQLIASDYDVILFGACSSGKTSLARALLKTMVGKTSPLSGTTKSIISYKINIKYLKRKINIIDTPGLFESSLEGEAREKLTIKKASKSDLIIFVVDQDLNKYEIYLIDKLTKIGKFIIIALNKCDLRNVYQNKIIIENIKNLTLKFSDKIEIIETIASPQSIPKKRGSTINKFINVDNLFSQIIKTLDKNGEELLADNILLQSNKLGFISKKIINQQREISCKKIINKYSWITSGVIFITPNPAFDFLATSAINVKMTLEISSIYDIKLTKERASELTKSIITVISTLGIVKGGMNLISNFLLLNFTTFFISKSINSITSAWIIRIVGLSFIKYFEQNQSWGDEGIQKVVQEIYEVNKREEILKDFLIEAVKNIKDNNNYSSTKILPPHFK